MQEVGTLIEAAKSGDPHAWDLLVEKERPRLLTYLSRKVRTREDAENLLQDILLSAYRHLNCFRGDCPFDKWLWRIAANACIHYYRQSGRTPKHISLDQPETEALVQQSAQENPLKGTEERILADQALEIARSVCSKTELQVMMFFYRTGSMEEVAGLMEMNPATVRSHFLRARANLLAHLFANDPEWLGGRDAIQVAINQVQASADPFTPEELGSIDQPEQSGKTFRKACLKIARRLPDLRGRD
jgi:RNA polymerase sigma-70 factor (ECF subfamily)